MNHLEKYRLVKFAANWSKDVQKEILTPNQQYPISYLTGEMSEFANAVKNRDKENIKEELQDVAYAGQMIPYQRMNINGPLFFADGSVQKFKDRKNVWEQIFSKHNVPFDNAYLQNGSNYKKPMKIKKALALGGIDITDDDAANLINELGIDAENETGYSSEERIAKLHPLVTQDPEFRKQELLKKLEEYKAEQSEKALADIYMAKQWAELSNADLSELPEMPEKNTAALLNRLLQLEDRVNTTGDLYAKKK